MNIPLRHLAAPMMVAGGAACLDRMMSGSNSSSKPTKMEAKPNGQAKLLFIGTGSSTGCPKPLCSMLLGADPAAIQQESPEFKRLREEYQDRCRVSQVAARGDPKTNKNYRNNPCFLIQSWDSSEGKMRNVVIDVGKTFRETTLRWFPEFDIRSLDAIVLTHHHMDAAGGADDLRPFQSFP